MELIFFQQFLVMKIKPIPNFLLITLLLTLASADDTMVFGITPNDPMVYCHVGDEYTGVDLISNSLSEKIYGYDIDLLKFYQTLLWL